MGDLLRYSFSSAIRCLEMLSSFVWTWAAVAHLEKDAEASMVAEFVRAFEKSSRSVLQ